MDEHIASSRRTDDQLLFMIDQTADWTVNGRGGTVLGLFHCLRDALVAVFGYEVAGHHVFAVCSRPGDAIIIFREQIARVAEAAGILAQGLPRRNAA